jgi:hypothetical protein
MRLIKTDFEVSDSINVARVKGMNIFKRAFSFRYIRYLIASLSFQSFKHFSTLWTYLRITSTERASFKSLSHIINGTCNQHFPPILKQEFDISV